MTLKTNKNAKAIGPQILLTKNSLESDCFKDAYLDELGNNKTRANPKSNNKKDCRIVSMGIFSTCHIPLTMAFRIAPE